MTKRILLGMLTPSSNTTLEPVTTQMVAGLPEVSAHFGRFRVTEIALSDQALGQFDIGHRGVGDLAQQWEEVAVGLDLCQGPLQHFRDRCQHGAGLEHARVAWELDGDLR